MQDGNSLCDRPGPPLRCWEKNHRRKEPSKLCCPHPQPPCDPDQPQGEEPGQEVDHPAKGWGAGGAG